MSLLPVSAILAAACLLSGCGGAFGDRGVLSAKAWDTPFVVVRPIPAPRPETSASGVHGSRFNPNLAAYGQLPASLEPSYVVDEPTAPDAAAETPDAPAAASAPASAAALAPVVVTVLPVVSTPKLPAESMLDDTVTVDKVSGAVASLDALHALRPPVEIGSRITVVELQPAVSDER